MAESRLRGFLNGTRQRVLWLEYDQYARQVFANAAADWWTQSTRFATTMIQARKAIHTEVVSFDLAAPGMAVTTPGEDPVALCKSALQHPEGWRFINDCCDALAHQLSTQVDLVLRVPVPLDLLRRAGAIDPGFDELDEIATTILATVRRCADKPIAGLLLTREADTPVSADEQDAYAPLIHAAKHYGWLACLQSTLATAEANAAQLADLDLVLCPELSTMQLQTLNRTPPKFGGGLPSVIWSSHDTPTTGNALLFGVIPADAKPETVLARCAELNG
jgi:hypothetical protein